MIDLTEMLERHEGIRALAYQDSLGIWTVGVGHNLARPLSAKAIMQILQDDITDATNDCRMAFPWYAELTHNRKAALVDLCFNLGLTRLMKFVKMLDALEHGNYATAASELLDSQWAKQVGNGRSHELAQLLRGSDQI